MPPSPQQLESIKVLLGMQSPSNAATSRSALRGQQLRERSPMGIGASPEFEAMVAQEDAEEEADFAADPLTQKYEAIQDAQSGGQVYNMPEMAQQRDDALTRTLAPIRERGKFDLEKQRIASQGQVAEAQAASRGRQTTQDATMARTQASQAGQAQRQRNQMLETQAVAAQKKSRNPLQWLMGAPSGEDQAATLRGQQQFGGQAGGAQDPGQLAQELFGEFADASPDQVAAYAQSELGITDPAAVQQLVAAYAAMQGR